MNYSFKKGFSLFILSVFILSDLGIAKASFAAVPQNPIGANSNLSAAIADPTRLDIPHEYASIQEIHKGSNGKLLIHLQDAHANYSGQMNLSKTLGHLMTQYDMSLVLSEGSAKDATLTKIRNAVPLKEWKRVAKSYLMKGVIHGEEYLNLTSEMPMQIRGIEYKSLYEDSIQVVSQIQSLRKEVLPYLNQIQKTVDRLKSKIYPRQILDFESKTNSSTEDLKRIQLLFDLAKEYGVSSDEYISLIQLQQIQALEQEIDFVRVNEEAHSLIQKVYGSNDKKSVMESMEKVYQEATSPLSQAQLLQKFIKDAAQIQVPMSDYAGLKQYLMYLDQFNALNVDLLMDEVDAFEERIYGQALQSDEELKLRIVDQYIGLLQKAYMIQLNSKEYALLTRNRNSLEDVAWQAFLNELVSKYEFWESIVPYQTTLKDSWPHIHDFYSKVALRDRAFVENSDRIMQEMNQDTAFLIAGGYHTENLTQILKKEGYSYIVLTPKVEHETDHELYEELLLDMVPQSIDGHDVSNSNIEEVMSKSIADQTLRHPLSNERFLALLGVLPGGSRTALQQAIEELNDRTEQDVPESFNDSVLADGSRLGKYEDYRDYTGHGGYKTPAIDLEAFIEDEDEASAPQSLNALSGGDSGDAALAAVGATAVGLAAANPESSRRNLLRTMAAGAGALALAPVTALGQAAAFVFGKDRQRAVQTAINTMSLTTTRSTGLIPSHPHNPDMQQATVVYDQARAIMSYVRTGEINRAKAASEIFIESSKIQKRVWVQVKDGRGKLTSVRKRQTGWIPNVLIDDATFEDLADVGPNTYLALAMIHLYRATGEEKYYEFAKNTANNIRELQNDDKDSANYGAIRMGPLGLPWEPGDQRPEYNPNAPRRYSTYNTENTTDAIRLFRDIAAIDKERGNEADARDAKDFESRAQLIVDAWLWKMYDPKTQLFYEGTIEAEGSETQVFENGMLRATKDPNSGVLKMVVKPGELNIVPIYPMDSAHLIGSAIGVEGFDVLVAKARGIAGIRKPLDPGDAFHKVVLATENEYREEAKLEGGETFVLYSPVGKSQRERQINYRKDPNDPLKRQALDGPVTVIGSPEWTVWYGMSLARGIAYHRTLMDKDEKSRERYEYYMKLHDEITNTLLLMTQNRVKIPYAVDMDTTRETGKITPASDEVFYAWNTPEFPKNGEFSLIGTASLIDHLTFFDPHDTVTKGPLAGLVDLPKINTIPAILTGTDKMGRRDIELLPVRVSAEKVIEKAWSRYNRGDVIGAGKSVESEALSNPNWIRKAKLENRLANFIAKMESQGLSRFPLDQQIKGLRAQSRALLDKDPDLSLQIDLLIEETLLLKEDLQKMGIDAGYIDRLTKAMFTSEPLSGDNGWWGSVYVNDKAIARTLKSIFGTYGILYEMGAASFIYSRGLEEQGVPAAQIQKKLEAIISPSDLWFSQVHDPNQGGLWQPRKALMDEVGITVNRPDGSRFAEADTSSIEASLTFSATTSFVGSADALPVIERSAIPFVPQVIQRGFNQAAIAINSPLGSRAAILDVSGIQATVTFSDAPAFQLPAGGRAAQKQMQDERAQRKAQDQEQIVVNAESLITSINQRRNADSPLYVVLETTPWALNVAVPSVQAAITGLRDHDDVIVIAGQSNQLRAKIREAIEQGASPNDMVGIVNNNTVTSLSDYEGEMTLLGIESDTESQSDARKKANDKKDPEQANLFGMVELAIHMRDDNMDAIRALYQTLTGNAFTEELASQLRQNKILSLLPKLYPVTLNISETARLMREALTSA